MCSLDVLQVMQLQLLHCDSRRLRCTFPDDEYRAATHSRVQMIFCLNSMLAWLMKSPLIIDQIEKMSHGYLKMDCEGDKCYGVLAVRIPLLSADIGVNLELGSSYLLCASAVPPLPQRVPHWCERHQGQACRHSERVRTSPLFILPYSRVADGGVLKPCFGLFWSSCPSLSLTASSCSGATTSQ